MINLFNGLKKGQFDRGFAKGQEISERHLAPIHRKELQDLEDAKNLEIVELKAELSSMQRRYDYWQDIYKKITKEKVQFKMDKKELQKVAEDILYFCNEKVIDNASVLQSVGQIVSRIIGKKLE